MCGSCLRVLLCVVHHLCNLWVSLYLPLLSVVGHMGWLCPMSHHFWLEGGHCGCPVFRSLCCVVFKKTCTSFRSTGTLYADWLDLFQVCFWALRVSLEWLLLAGNLSHVCWKPRCSTRVLHTVTNVTSLSLRELWSRSAPLSQSVTLCTDGLVSSSRLRLLCGAPSFLVLPLAASRHLSLADSSPRSAWDPPSHRCAGAFEFKSSGRPSFLADPSPLLCLKTGASSRSSH